MHLAGSQFFASNSCLIQSCSINCLISEVTKPKLREVFIYVRSLKMGKCKQQNYEALKFVIHSYDPGMDH